jgi:hypothetical protein
MEILKDTVPEEKEGLPQIGLLRSFSFVFQSAGEPILLFSSEVEYDVAVISKILSDYAVSEEEEKVNPEVAIMPITFNASPLDQEVYAVPMGLFSSFFLALRCVSCSDADNIRRLPSDTKVFLFLFR